MIQAVIFDLDDTLVKTHVVKWAHHKQVARDFYGHELTDEKLREHWGKPFDSMVMDLHGPIDTLENMHKAYASNADKFLKEIHDDSMDVIHTLRERGIEIGIVTATNKEFVVRDLQRLEFPLEQFFCIQAADETLYHKPDPRVFEPILEKLEQLNISKEATVYVGDAVADFRAARDAGLHFVAVATGLHSTEEFQEEGVEHIITRLEHLPDLVAMLS